MVATVLLLLIMLLLIMLLLMLILLLLLLPSPPLCACAWAWACPASSVKQLRTARRHATVAPLCTAKRLTSTPKTRMGCCSGRTQ